MLKPLRLALVMITGLLAACSAPAAAPPTAAAPTALPTAVRPDLPEFGVFDPASVTEIDLGALPVIPDISANAIAIYRRGLLRGNQARVFSKLGDCMTENPYFLAPFAAGGYDLGQYAELQAVLDQYAGTSARPGTDWSQDSFATVSLASASGFNIAGPLDATWADPKWCQGGESPAACEFRVAQPSVAVIMFGTNDVAYTDPASYDYFLRTLVDQAVERDVLPLLSTFPTRPEDPDKSRLLNQIVVRVAQAYDIPLINLSRALEPLPHHGVNPEDTIHLSTPADGRVDIFDAEHLQAGFTVRNLVTMQALQAVLEATREARISQSPPAQTTPPPPSVESRRNAG